MSEEFEQKTSRKFRTVTGIFLALQAAILFGLFNPWNESWRGLSLAFLACEIFFLIFLFFPLFLYHYFKRKKGFKGSVTTALDTLMDWMGYFTP